MTILKPVTDEDLRIQFPHIRVLEKLLAELLRRIFWLPDDELKSPEEYAKEILALVQADHKAELARIFQETESHHLIEEQANVRPGLGVVIERKLLGDCNWWQALKERVK